MCVCVVVWECEYSCPCMPEKRVMSPRARVTGSVILCNKGASNQTQVFRVIKNLNEKISIGIVCASKMSVTGKK